MILIFCCRPYVTVKSRLSSSSLLLLLLNIPGSPASCDEEGWNSDPEEEAEELQQKLDQHWGEQRHTADHEIWIHR